MLKKTKSVVHIHGLSPEGLKKVEEYIQMVKKVEEIPKEDDD